MSASRPRVFRAPGRVNLIGEHTDYSGGYVLPVALNLACEVGAAPSVNGRLRVRSIDLGREASWEVEQIDTAQPRGEWSDYVVGVALQLAKRGVPIPTGELAVSSTVPLGAGLSSSAALEVGVGLALLGLADHRLPREELAQACQAAEVEFVGLQCGIMDQFASLFGKRDHAILIDCRSLDHSLVALPPDLGAGPDFRELVRQAVHQHRVMALLARREQIPP